jgi:membrane protein YqaA with SNARE-associated domain
VQSVLQALDGFGGIYVALFLFAMLSAVFPIASSELALVTFATAAGFGVPKLLVLALIVALAQSSVHAMLYQSAKGLAKAGAQRRPKLEARIAKARQLAARWEKSELSLIALGATVGVPPLALIALVAGAIGVRFRTFILIGVFGRILRFSTIVLVAHLF